MRRIACLLLCSVTLFAQADVPATPRQFLPAMERGVQLMEAAGAVVPELSRSSAPLVEAARQAVTALKSPEIRQDDSRVVYSYLGSLRAFLALSDALPKPYPFPEEGARQFVELRTNAATMEAVFRRLLDLREATALGSDRDQLRRYAEANTRVGPPVEGKPRVVFFGDSITDGWRLNEYFPDRDFINRGISGQITSQMLARMQSDVIAHKPAAMLILAGTNDIARGVPAGTIRDNLTMIAALAEHAKIKPVFASILPVSDYHKAANPRFMMTRTRPPAAILAMNAWLKQFCQTRGYVYLDYFAAMVDGAGFLKAELADDGLHPNAAGYRVMAPLALDAVGKAIPPPPAPGKKRK